MTLILIKVLCSLLITYVIVYNVKFPYDNAVFEINSWLILITFVLVMFSFIWIGV